MPEMRITRANLNNRRFEKKRIRVEPGVLEARRLRGFHRRICGEKGRVRLEHIKYAIAMKRVFVSGREDNMNFSCRNITCV